MQSGCQKTVKAPVEFAGIGLHTGVECRVIVRPAAANAGIVFRRCDQGGPDNLIPACAENVVRADHGTALANAAGARVETVEHLMAALALVGIDNAVIDIVGPEAPILDGSAALFVSGLKEAGLIEEQAARNIVFIKETLVVRDGDRSIVIEPFDGFSLDVEIDFEDCLIGRQSLTLHLDQPCDQVRLAKSRTFCRLHEIQPLRRAGLIRGGSLNNSIVVDGDRLLNRDALRDPEEFVLHKGLDLIGDLYLLGAPIRGAIRATKPGHDLNTRLARAAARRYGFGAPADGAPAMRATA